MALQVSTLWLRDGRVQTCGKWCLTVCYQEDPKLFVQISLNQYNKGSQIEKRKRVGPKNPWTLLSADVPEMKRDTNLYLHLEFLINYFVEYTKYILCQIIHQGPMTKLTKTRAVCPWTKDSYLFLFRKADNWLYALQGLEKYIGRKRSRSAIKKEEAVSVLHFKQDTEVFRLEVVHS